MFKNIIVSVLVAISCFVARGEEDNVLLWWFNDPVITDFDGSTYKADTLVGRGAAEGKQANIVRISSIDSDGNKVYLTMGSFEMPGYCADGLGIPDWYNQNKAGPGWADIGGLNLNDISLQFAMELGYAEFDENGEYTTWLVLASASESLQTMISGGHINASELSYEGNIPWSVTGMSVPEPNSGILIFIGSCILMLMRPRKMMYN